MNNQVDIMDGVWFIYDGDCPICTRAAEALRIKENCGEIHIVNARTEHNTNLVKEVNRLKYDLDEGMVIYNRGIYYHGSDALNFMAVYGAPTGFFNRINIVLFKNKTIAAICYPAMRGTRNLLLWVLGKTPIKNLFARNEPIFKNIFNDSWNELPVVFHKHYQNRPYSNDAYSCKGQMDVKAHILLRFVAPISHLLGGIPIVNQENIPVKVTFKSDPDNINLDFVREFHFNEDKPYVFHSTMIPTGENKITEKMKFGLCWCSKFSWQEDKVKLDHNGYRLSFFGKLIPMPITWLIGHIHAEEVAVSDTKFKMYVKIHHWLFGELYEYRGTFQMEECDE